MNDFGPKRPMSEDALCVPADTVKTKRGRPKKKPGYDRAEVIDDLLVKVVEFFGTPFDDREERPEDAPTIVSVANGQYDQTKRDLQVLELKTVQRYNYK